MGKVNLTEASLINEQDRTPKCESCFAMAEEGETYCMTCKMYWEEDAAAIDEAEFQHEMAELEQRLIEGEL